MHPTATKPVDTKLTSDEAAALHYAAITRDYAIQPRLGKPQPLQSRFHFILPLFILSFFSSSCCCLDYRTVSGVNGPLVILDNVKVSLLSLSLFHLTLSLLSPCLWMFLFLSVSSIC